jgi:PAS domain S-box-containing protein
VYECLQDCQLVPAESPDNRQLFQSIIGALREIVFRTDAAGLWTFLNPAWEEITGYSVAESLGTLFLDYVYPDDRELNLERFRPLIERRKEYCRHEIRYRHKSGGFRWVEVHARLVYEAGEVAGTCGIIRDVTARRQSLEDLNATRARLQYLLDSSPAVIYTLDPSRSYAVTWCSENVLSMFGYTAQQFADNPRLWLQVFHPQDRQRFRDFKQRLKAGAPEAVQVRYRHRDGTCHWLRSEVKTHSATEAVGCLVDTTEAMQALERLQLREAILEAISFVASRFLEREDWEAALPESLEHLRQATRVDCIWLLEKVECGGITMLRPRYGSSAHLPLMTEAGLFPSIAEFENTLDRGETICVRVSELPESVRNLLLNPRTRTMVSAPVFVGAERWGVLGFDCEADREWPPAMLDGLRTAARIIGAAIRQSQAMQSLREAQEKLELRVDRRTRELAAANTALRESEQLYRTLVELSPDAIVVSDMDHRIAMVNHRCQELFRFVDPGEVLGRDGEQWVTGEDRQAALRFRADLLTEGHLHGWELRLLRCDGTAFVAEVDGSLVNDEQNRPCHILRVIRDVTARRQLEDQYRQAQKMEAVGRLAGGVAHDFNNLLTVIKGYSDLLMHRLRDDEGNGKKVAQILKAADRAARLVEQLLAFSRKQIVEPKVLDVNAALGEMERMLGRLIGEDIEFVTCYDSDAGNIRIDPGHFDQMIMNLAVNARDAMHGGGTFSLATRHARMAEDTHEPALSSLQPGRYLLIEVQDTGEGMSADVLPHIFEPFFTTKQVGKGTGLGLSTVYGIVEQAGGRILVESTPGSGSTFRIYLPVVEGDATPEFSMTTAGTWRGQETILVAEDSDSVRTMIVESLEERGYTVLAARNGHHALEIASSAGSALDLLVTDVVMPRLGGLDLAAELVELHPRIRVLYISGYTERKLPDGAPFLRKPFSPDELSAAVRRALAAHQENAAAR